MDKSRQTVYPRTWAHNYSLQRWTKPRQGLIGSLRYNSTTVRANVAVMKKMHFIIRHLYKLNKYIIMLERYIYQIITWICPFHAVVVAKKYKTTQYTVTCVMTTFARTSVIWIVTTNNGRSFNFVVLCISKSKLENLQNCRRM